MASLFYDALTFMLRIVLILVIVVWSAQYGLGIVNDILGASPNIIQLYGASALTAAASSTSFDSRLDFEKPLSVNMKLILTDKTVVVEPEKTSGSTISFSKSVPDIYARADGVGVQGTTLYLEKGDKGTKSLVAERRSNSIRAYATK